MDHETTNSGGPPSSSSSPEGCGLGDDASEPMTSANNNCVASSSLLLEASLRSSLALMDAIESSSALLYVNTDSKGGVSEILGEIERRVEEMRGRLGEGGARRTESSDEGVGGTVGGVRRPLHEVRNHVENAVRVSVPSAVDLLGHHSNGSIGSFPDGLSAVQKAENVAGRSDRGGDEAEGGGATHRKHSRRLSQPFLEIPTVDQMAQPGEPPPSNTSALLQGRMSYIMPGAGHPRRRSNAGGSVHPGTDPVGEQPTVDEVFGKFGGSSRRGSRRTISQLPSRPYERKQSVKENWRTVARDAFGIIDVNNDGYLQREEVIAAIKMMKDQGATDFDMDPAEMADSMMVEVDIDGDGQIDIDEFVEMMRKSTQLPMSGGTGGVSAFSYNHRMSQLARNVLLAHQKKIENAVVGEDLWMIHPLSNMHAAWDVIVSLLILLTVLTMPLSLGWEEFNEDFFVMNLTVDFIFLLDVCKNFCTGFIDENDAIIMDAKTVRWNYLTGFFVSDFCSSIPLDLILRATGTTGNSAVSSTKQSVKMLKLLRMGKLFRLLRISRLFRHVKEIVVMTEERFNIRVSDGFTKLIRLGIGALVLGHWIGCFNFMLVRLNDFPEDSWVVYAGLEEKDAFTQWSWSFFKALAQMIMIGFETPPFTNASCDTASEWCSIEHWITLGCLYLGAVFYSLLISSISAILQSANLASRQFEEKLMQIDDYMRNKRLPAAMREKVKDYFHLQHSNGKLYNEAEILDMVTPILRREIKSFNGRDITVKVPLLSTMTNKEFAEEMTTVLEPTIAFQNEIILREKTTGEEMYFITSGVVEIFLSSAKNAAYVAIGDGCYFGEVSLVLGCRRTASARTKTQCMLYRISRQKLLATLHDFPEMEATMKRVAKSRQRRLNHYVSPTTNPLLPEDEVDSEDCKTELFGVDADRVASAKEEQFEMSRKGRQSHRVSNLQRPPTPQRRKAHLGHGRGARQ